MLYGFAGFGPEPNPAGSHTGVDRCLTVNGLPAYQDPTSALAQGDSELDIPCYNVADVNSSGQAVPRRSTGSGHIHRLNVQWKPHDGLMFYATWSRGFRPGGINRQPDTPAYAPDFLTNYEAGWKTTFGGSRLRWNGAIYHQIWSSFQFGYLGQNSLTVIQNGRNATVDGIESDINYVRRSFRSRRREPTPRQKPAVTFARIRSSLTHRPIALGLPGIPLKCHRVRAWRLRPKSRRAQRRATLGRSGPENCTSRAQSAIKDRHSRSFDLRRSSLLE